MREYRRHLPHQIPDETPIFVTWNLKGAIPREVLERLQREREQSAKGPPRAGETPRERSLRLGKLQFAKVDEFLDSATSGPQHPRDTAAAKIVEDAILFAAAERVQLFAWCVMPNHVHVLFTPLWDFSKVMKGLKGFTARQINLSQKSVGRTFWQDESYDHWVRDEDELLRIIYYIENNPVKAGLCRESQDWEWSSARRRANWPIGQPFRLTP